MKNIQDMTMTELLAEQRRLEARKAELNLQMRELRFKKYPPKVRAIMKRIGWAPDDTVIRRVGGSFEAKK